MTRLRGWALAYPALLLVIVAFALRLLPAFVRFVIGSDDGLFLTLGQNLAAGHGYTGDGVTTQIDFPPGYPLFAAAVYALGGGLELPTRLNMLVIGSLLPLAIWWLARQLTDDGLTALLAGLLTALHPALVLAQGNFESVAEQPYALLLYTGWGVLWWAIHHRRRLWAFGLAGALIGLAHLVRWEGIILGLLGAGLLVLFLWRDRRRLIPALALFLGGLLLLAAPYALYLYRHTGSILSPKTMLTQLHAAAIDATAADPWAFERSFYQHYDTWLADPTRPPDVLQESRLAFARRYLANLLHEVRLWLTVTSFFTVIWLIPFVVGVAALPRRAMLFLLPLFVPLGFIPASVVDPRYFLIPLPIMMIFTAAGWRWLLRRFPRPRLSGIGLSLAQVGLAGTLALFAAASLAGPFLYPRPVGYRAAGLALRDEIPPGSHILARKRQLPFYAGGVWHWLPFAELDEVLAYAHRRNARYLVVDVYTTPSLRPQLADLLDPGQSPAALKAIFVSDTVIVYQILDDSAGSSTIEVVTVCCGVTKSCRSM